MGPTIICNGYVPGRKLAEGKTKIICEVIDHPDLVMIISKSDLTKGDGAVRIELEGKNEWANATTCRAFELIRGIPTHYLGQLDASSFLAYKLDMFPFEFVVREWAEGSVLDRDKSVKKGDHFFPYKLEVFFKDDALNDPIMVWNESKLWWDLHNAHMPITTDSFIKELPRDIHMPTKEEFDLISTYQIVAFDALKNGLLKAGIRIKDLKLEYGRDIYGRVRLGDVADNDSWRIEFIENAVELSKQYFRNEKIITDGVIAKLKDKFSLVARIMEEIVPQKDKRYLILGRL